MPMNDAKIDQLAREALLQATPKRTAFDEAILAAARDQATLNRQTASEPTNSRQSNLQKSASGLRVKWWQRPVWLGAGSTVAVIATTLLLTSQPNPTSESDQAGREVASAPSVSKSELPTSTPVQISAPVLRAPATPEPAAAAPAAGPSSEAANSSTQIAKPAPQGALSAPKAEAPARINQSPPVAAASSSPSVQTPISAAPLPPRSAIAAPTDIASGPAPAPAPAPASAPAPPAPPASSPPAPRVLARSANPPSVTADTASNLERSEQLSVAGSTERAKQSSRTVDSTEPDPTQCRKQLLQITVEARNAENPVWVTLATSCAKRFPNEKWELHLGPVGDLKSSR
jgi:hypothetical protein